MCIRFLPSLFALGTLAQAGQITHEGTPAAEIVIEASSAPIQYAGEELKNWTKRISGAELPLELIARSQRLFEKWLVVEKNLGERVILDVPLNAASAGEDLNFWQGGNVHRPAGFQTLRLKLD